MATKLRASGRRFVREARGRALVYTIEVVPAGVLIRVKGRHTVYGPVPWDMIYSLGAKLEAAQASSASTADTWVRLGDGAP